MSLEYVKSVSMCSQIVIFKGIFCVLGIGELLITTHSFIMYTKNTNKSKKILREYHANSLGEKTTEQDGKHPTTQHKCTAQCTSATLLHFDIIIHTCLRCYLHQCQTFHAKLYLSFIGMVRWCKCCKLTTSVEII